MDLDRALTGIGILQQEFNRLNYFLTGETPFSQADGAALANDHVNVGCLLGLQANANEGRARSADGLQCSLPAVNVLRAKSVKRKNLNLSETKPKLFDAIVQKEGSFIFIAIPFSPREVWGAKPRYSVTGTINGISVQGTLGVLGQDYFLRLGKAWMQESKMEIGENVTVRLSLKSP